MSLARVLCLDNSRVLSNLVAIAVAVVAVAVAAVGSRKWAAKRALVARAESELPLFSELTERACELQEKTASLAAADECQLQMIYADRRSHARAPPPPPKLID